MVNFGTCRHMSLTTSITPADFERLQNNIHQNILVTLNQFFADCLKKNCLFSIVYENGRVLITVDGVQLDPRISTVLFKFTSKFYILKLQPKPGEFGFENSSSVISNDDNCKYYQFLKDPK